MGRHTGWLTAAGVLARRNPDDGPHLIYVPEVGISMSQFIEDVDRVYQAQGRCLVAVSEGICDEKGELWAKRAQTVMEQDAHGNVTLSGTGLLADLLISELRRVKPKIKRMRGDTFGYLQRCFPTVYSKTDFDEAYTVGQEAVHYATDWAMDGSVAIRRLNKKGTKYETETFLTPLSSVAAKTKTMPKEYCDKPGIINEAFLDYIKPLVGKLPQCAKLF
jgi:6-phosphofructokinase 1